MAKVIVRLIRMGPDSVTIRAVLDDERILLRELSFDNPAEIEIPNPPRRRTRREYAEHACPKPSTWWRRTGSLWVCWCGRAYSLEEFDDPHDAWREWVRWAPWEE